uniref:phosphoserine phosphatase n=1 Tax=Paramoeba aestuarina TaxID=180227 RepID=A0A7S4NVH0_9EUKA
MTGGMTFQDALSARLNLMKPTQKQLNEFVTNHPLPLTLFVADFVAKLLENKVGVFLISGGFEEMIFPIADVLKIQRENVMANAILFHEDGTFKDHDREKYTCRTGGKKKKQYLP